MLDMVFQISCVCGFRSICILKTKIHLYLVFYDEKQTSKRRALCGLWSAMAHTVVSLAEMTRFLVVRMRTPRHTRWSLQ